MRCSREYFEALRMEALKKKEGFELKRFDTPMRIEGWKVDVCDAVLKYCFDGLYLEDVGIAIIEATLNRQGVLLNDRGRKMVVRVCTEMLLIPRGNETPCLQHQ